VIQDSGVYRIKMDGVNKSFVYEDERFLRGSSTLKVLSNLSFSISNGEFVCLLGPSGCGKSTVLNILAGFEKPDSGSVFVDGRLIDVPGRDRGVVFQQPTLYPWLSVIENVTFGLRLAGVSLKKREDEARRYLRMVELTGFERYASWQLSGGMRQRAALARALISNPSILLMDEPFASLDAQTRISMQELISGISASTKSTILFITHDTDEALFLADRILIMSSRPGTIVEELRVPFEKPRDIEVLTGDAKASELRRYVLRRVRDEAKNFINGNI
jgi:NitT/TauT family transport system ATP-binding protein